MDASVPDDFARAVVTPASYAAPERLHEGFAWLRGNRPVAKLTAPNARPFWLVTRHQDIVRIERDPDLFHNGDQSTVYAPADMLAGIEAATGGPHLTRNMVNMDGAELRAYRSLTQSWFMPGNVKKLTDRIRQIARTHVDRLLATGSTCDFVRDVALHYPLHVVMEILGVPREDEGRMLLLTQQLFGARDPELGRSSAARADPAQALQVFQAVLGDFYAYFRALTAERRRAPRDDVASIIANAVIKGEPIADHEANSYYILLATAGHDTTSASTSGAMMALAQDPELLCTVQANPALIGNLVDEAIRWTTLVKHFMRSATRDCELAGQQIRQGDWLMMSYMSANRDEAVFADPFAFRLDRDGSSHLAFGQGAHLCFGQHLAKLEMRILFEELLPHIKELRLDGEPVWTQSVFISGPKHLPIGFVTH